MRQTKINKPLQHVQQLVLHTIPKHAGLCKRKNRRAAFWGKHLHFYQNFVRVGHNLADGAALTLKKTRFSPEILQEIKDRVSLVDVVRAVVPNLKLKGHDYWGCCPFHNEKSASFHVSDDKGFYHCFGCGAHGNVFDFVTETRGGTFIEAVEYLAAKAGVKLIETQIDPKAAAKQKNGLQTLERAAVFYQRNLEGAALAYIAGRGLTEETLKTFRIGYAPEGWHDTANALRNEGFGTEILLHTGLLVEKNNAQAGGKGGYDRFRGRLMFPICNIKGDVVAFGGRVLDGGEPKYLNSPETDFFHKGQTLYNLHAAREAIRKENRAFIVEGYMDVVALWQHGIRTAVAPLGTAITPEQVRLLWRYHNMPVSCLDGDAAGRAAAVRLAKRILPALVPGKSVRFMWMPDGEDPDTFVKKYGADAFNTLAENTVSIDAVLWDDLTTDADLTTADGRALVDSGIAALLKEISNETVRKHFGKTLRDRLWQKPPRGAGGRSRGYGGYAGVGGAQSVASLALPTSSDGLARSLLALMLRRPQLFAAVQEKFAALQFENQQHNTLQTAIFKKMSMPGVENQPLTDYLQSRGVADIAEELCRQTLVDTLLQQPRSAQDLWLSLWQEWQERHHSKQAVHTAINDEQTFEQMRAHWNKMREKRNLAGSS